MAALLASDFSAGINGFWLRHQVVTSIVTGIVLSVAIIFGLERAMRARNRARWRPIGIRIAKSFLHRTGTDELLTLVTLGYCERRYGEMEIPEGRHFFELLPEALQGPEAWEGSASAPGLLEQVEEELLGLEDALTTWTPVLISEPELAPIGISAMELADAIRQIFGALMVGDPRVDDEKTPEDLWAPGARARLWLLAGVVLHRVAVRELQELFDTYSAG